MAFYRKGGEIEWVPWFLIIDLLVDYGGIKLLVVSQKDGQILLNCLIAIQKLYRISDSGSAGVKEDIQLSAVSYGGHS